MKLNKLILILFITLTLTACTKENKEENKKNEYIALKSTLISNEEYTEKDELPCDITISVDRVEEDKIKYKVIMNNPKENMHNIKALAIHNYFTEEIFPSIGLFDSKKELLINEDNTEKIELVGFIDSEKSIDNLNLKIKLWIEYTDDFDETKDIYYKTT